MFWRPPRGKYIVRGGLCNHAVSEIEAFLFLLFSRFQFLWQKICLEKRKPGRGGLSLRFPLSLPLPLAAGPCRAFARQRRFSCCILLSFVPARSRTHLRLCNGRGRAAEAITRRTTWTNPTGKGPTGLFSFSSFALFFPSRSKTQSLTIRKKSQLANNEREREIRNLQDDDIDVRGKSPSGKLSLNTATPCSCSSGMLDTRTPRRALALCSIFARFLPTKARAHLAAAHTTGRRTYTLRQTSIKEDDDFDYR